MNCTLFIFYKFLFYNHIQHTRYSTNYQRLGHTSVERGGHLCGVSGTQVWNKSHTSVEQTPFKCLVFGCYSRSVLRC